MFNIDVSFWRAEQMPVYIQRLIGYDTDNVTIKGGVRTYHYVRVFGWGTEVTITRVTKREGTDNHGHSSYGEAAAPAAYARHRS